MAFLLNQGLLYSTKKDGTILSGVLDLTYAYVEVKRTGKEEYPNINFCISIEKNNRYTSVYLQDHESLDEWLALLGPYCVQRNFSSFYATEGLLGEGSYGSVFLVKNKRTKVLYATKAFSKQELEAKEDAYDAVTNEIEIMKRLGKEPNFTGYYGVFESTNSLYLVMEYVKGEPIFEIMNFRRFSEQKRANILD